MRHAAALAAFAALLIAPWTARGDEPVETEFDRTLERIGSQIEEVESREWPTDEAFRGAIAQVRLEGLSTLDFGALTTEQIDRITRKRYFGSLGYEPDYTSQAIEPLVPRAAEPTPDGAYAASVRAQILARNPAHREAAPTASLDAIRHPAAALLLLDDRGDAQFYNAARALRVVAPEGAPPLALAAIRSFLQQIPPDFDPGNLSGADNLHEALAQHDSAEAQAAAEGVRLRLLALGRERLARGDLSEDDRWWPELRLAFLEHAPTRLRLLDSPAPEIEFAWWSDQAAPASRLSDLRGEIVVLDVWASSCGFCLPALQARAAFAPGYEGRGVRFVALTEHEAEFWTCYDTETIVDTPTIEDTARAAKAYGEANALAGAIAVVNDASDAFDASYGVRGVPTTFVIDHRGVVRGVHHDPRHPDKTSALLDQLLEERRAALAAP